MIELVKIKQKVTIFSTATLHYLSSQAYFFEFESISLSIDFTQIKKTNNVPMQKDKLLHCTIPGSVFYAPTKLDGVLECLRA